MKLVLGVPMIEAVHVLPFMNEQYLGVEHNCYKQVTANTYWLVRRILRCHVEGLRLWHHDGSSVCRLVGTENVLLLSSTKHKFMH